MLSIYEEITTDNVTEMKAESIWPLPSSQHRKLTSQLSIRENNQSLVLCVIDPML